ncbi:hypothetical protein BB560_002351 [Smittium megazygosporum]|uniref:SMC hinge domain-containing protein n=1 Tax=Smittium megazygosporum TaxID=133381 RepID=A0A2T9ZF07_9FUNG|nr:hypothetical protein BB560_002351 [Smittium megazygosporum]
MLVNSTKSEIENISTNKEELIQNRKKDTSKNLDFRAKQSKIDDISKEMIKIKAKLDITESSIAEETQNKKDLSSQVENTQKNLTLLEKKLEKHSQDYNLKKDQLIQTQEKVKQMDQLLQSLTTGVTTNEENSGGFIQQLEDARKSQLEAKTRAEQLEIKSKTLIKEKSDLSSKLEKSHLEIKQLLLKKQNLENNISKLSSEQDEISALADAQSKKLATLEKEEKYFSNMLANLDFRYSNPEPGFNRSSVKGIVAQLIRIDKEKKYASQALEICAGGRLFNVVVDTDATGAKLLDKGKLVKRVTIIPLNKINPRIASINSLKAAKSLAPGKVDLALSFIGYDKEISKAMEFVFGNSLICQGIKNFDINAETAKLVTFNKNIKLKSITLDGDVYDPSGTLQGGSKPSNSGVLEKLVKLNDLRMELSSVKAKYNELLSKIESKSAAKEAFVKYSSQIDLDRHALSLVQSQIDSSTFSKMEKRIQEIENDLQDYKNQILEAKKIESECSQKVVKIQNDMNEFSNDKEGKLRELRGNLKKLQKDVQKLQEEAKKLQKLAQTSEIEFEEQKAELNQLQSQLKSGADTRVQLEKEKAEKELELIEMKKEYDQLNLELGNAQMLLQEYDQEIRELEELFKRKTYLVNNSKIEIQKLEREISRLKSEKESVNNFIETTKNNPKNSWIAEMLHLFGQSDTAFDFVKQNPVNAKKSLNMLKERIEILAKTTNLTVQSNIESVEVRETSLKQMMRTVLRDKRKIQDTINSLDKYKLEALERTWKIVNEDFGNIFSELLPGNTAKLEPIEKMPITEGLQVRVNLGGVWKNSLTELSGGQRSLVALSLILALLQFKPAPMYILDEIDAALDLSHTQNIGKLFKSRFKGSQFIVVSLKEGMFNNANALFRVKFRNGVSMIEKSKVCFLKQGPKRHYWYSANQLSFSDLKARQGIFNYVMISSEPANKVNLLQVRSASNAYTTNSRNLNSNSYSSHKTRFSNIFRDRRLTQQDLEYLNAHLKQPETLVYKFNPKTKFFKWLIPLAFLQLLIWINLADIAWSYMVEEEDEETSNLESGSILSDTNTDYQSDISESEDVTLESTSNTSGEDKLSSKQQPKLAPPLQRGAISAGFLAVGFGISCFILVYSGRVVRSAKLTNFGSSLEMTTKKFPNRVVIHKIPTSEIFSVKPLCAATVLKTSDPQPEKKITTRSKVGLKAGVVAQQKVKDPSKVQTVNTAKQSENQILRDGINKQWVLNSKRRFGFVFDRTGFFPNPKLMDILFYRH